MSDKDLKAAARRWAYEYMLCNFEIPEHAQDDEYMAAKYITQCLAPPTMEELPWDRDRHFLAGASDGEYDYVMISPYRHDEESFLEIATIDCGSSNLMMVDAHSLIPNGERYELVEVTDKPENPVEPSTKTMDEYTLSERTDMVGMWAGYNRHRLGGKPTDFVIITGEENETGRVPCYNPGAPAPHDWAPDLWMLTPRFDMPRAWSTDGDPCAPTVSANENVGSDQPGHPETLTTVEDYEDAPKGTVVANDACAAYEKKTKNAWRSTYNCEYSDEVMADIPRKVLRWGRGDEA